MEQMWEKVYYIEYLVYMWWTVARRLVVRRFGAQTQIDKKYVFLHFSLGFVRSFGFGEMR